MILRNSCSKLPAHTSTMRASSPYVLRARVRYGAGSRGIDDDDDADEAEEDDDDVVPLPLPLLPLLVVVPFIPLGMDAPLLPGMAADLLPVAAPARLDASDDADVAVAAV